MNSSPRPLARVAAPEPVALPPNASEGSGNESPAINASGSVALQVPAPMAKAMAVAASPRGLAEGAVRQTETHAPMPSPLDELVTRFEQALAGPSDQGHALPAEVLEAGSFLPDDPRLNPLLASMMQAAFGAVGAPVPQQALPSSIDGRLALAGSAPLTSRAAVTGPTAADAAQLPSVATALEAPIVAAVNAERNASSLAVRVPSPPMEAVFEGSPEVESAQEPSLSPSPGARGHPAHTLHVQEAEHVDFAPLPLQSVSEIPLDLDVAPSTEDPATPSATLSAVTPFAALPSGLISSQPLPPSVPPAHAFMAREAIWRQVQAVADRMAAGLGASGVHQIRLDIDPRVLPGVQAVMQVMAGQVQLEFICASDNSRRLLRSVAQRDLGAMASRLKCPVQLTLRSADADGAGGLLSEDEEFMHVGA